MIKLKKEYTIAFKVTKEMKDKIIKSANQYKTANVFQPLTLSDFCRIAVNRFVKELEKNE